MRSLMRLFCCLLLAVCFLGVSYLPVVAQGPIGSIEMYAGDFENVPDGYFLCNGHCYDPVVYPDLFNVITYTYGTDLSGYFCVPDLRATYPVGSNHGATACAGSCPPFWPDLAATGGEISHTLTVNEIPSHLHYINGYGGSGSPVLAAGSTYYLPYQGGAYLNLYSTNNTGGGKPHNNNPPYLALNFIISYTSTQITPTATPTATATPTPTPTSAPPLATPAAYTNTLTTGTVLYQYSSVSFGQIFIATVGIGLVGTNILMLVVIRKRR